MGQLLERIEKLEDNFDRLYSIMMARIDILEQAIEDHKQEHEDTDHKYGKMEVNKKDVLSVFVLITVVFAMIIGMGIKFYTSIWFWVILLIPGFYVMFISSRDYYLQQKAWRNKNGQENTGKI